MSWFMVDDGLYDKPSLDYLPLAALGLWVKAGSWMGRQSRNEDYDGTIRLRHVKRLGGTKAQAMQLVAAGLWDRIAEDAFRPVEDERLWKLAGSRELSEKRAAAGRAGGRASGQARRSKREASRRSDDEANASDDGEANGKQHEGNPAKQTSVTDEAFGSSKREANAKQLLQAKTKHPDHTHTDTNPNLPPAPSEATPGRGSMAGAVASVEADPFAAAWSAHPVHSGSKAKAKAEWERLCESGSDPLRLFGAVLAYANSVAEGEIHTPCNLAHWLASEQWRDWQPKPKPQPLPDEAWLQAHLNQPLEESGVDSIEAMRARKPFFQLVRQGHDWAQAAQETISQTIESTERIPA